MLFIRGKAMSGAPIMIGTNQLPKPPIIAGMTMKKTMIRPWAVISTFHMCSAFVEVAAHAGTERPGARSEILDAGLGQLGAHQARNGAADDPRDDREDQIERADVLVVGRHEPADEEARLVVGVMMRVVRVMGLRNGSASADGVGHVCLVSASLILGRCGLVGRRLRRRRGDGVAGSAAGAVGSRRAAAGAAGAAPWACAALRGDPGVERRFAAPPRPRSACSRGGRRTVRCTAP